MLMGGAGVLHIWSRLLVVVGVAVSTLFAAAALVLFSLGLYCCHLANRALAEASAEGLPITFAEAATILPAQAGENAADYYLRAYNAYTESDAGRDLIEEMAGRGLDYPFSTETRMKITEVLEANRETIALLKKGSGIRECLYTKDPEDRLDAGVPNLQNMRKASLLLLIEAAYHMDNGVMEAATESMATAFVVGNSLKNEVKVTSLLRRYSILAVAAGRLQGFIRNMDFSDKQLAHLSETIESCESESVAGCIPLELAYLLTYFREQSGYFIKNTNIDNSVRTCISLQKAAKAPLPERLTAVRRAKHSVSSPLYMRLTELSNMMLDPVFSAFEVEAAHIALMRAARVGLASERFRLANGRLPGSITELVPQYLAEPPVDPFTGSPLRLTQSREGLFICSVGPDRSDDGGAGSDICFRLRP
jgi:hypothetical protein